MVGQIFSDPRPIVPLFSKILSEKGLPDQHLNEWTGLPDG